MFGLLERMARGCGCGGHLLLLVAILYSTVPPAGAANVTWSSTAVSSLWNDGGNWAGGVVPASLDDLFFGSTSGPTTLDNNLTAGFNIRSLTFNSGATAYVLGGNRVVIGSGVAGHITNNSTSLQTFAFDMTSSSGQQRNWFMTAGGGDFLVTGPYTGGMALTGSGVMTLSGTVRGSSTTINPNTTLRVAVPGSLPNAIPSFAVTRLAGGTLDLRNDVGQNFSTAPMTAISNNIFINVDRAVGGTGSNQTMTIGNISRNSSGTILFGVSGGNGYGLTTGTVAFTNVGNASTITLRNNAPGRLSLAAVGFDSGPFGNYSTMLLEGTGAIEIGGLRSDNQSTSGTIGMGSYSVVKRDAITTTISGASTYVGTTRVEAGMLRSTANAGLGGAGIARELGRAIGTLTVSGSSAASTVDFSGVTANNVVNLAGGNAGSSLINSSTATATTLDNGVAGVTFTNGGSGFTLATLNANGVISFAGGGAAAEISSLGGSLGTATIAGGGTGYTVGSVLELTGGGITAGSNSARYSVASVDGTGAITALSLNRVGNGYTSLPTGFNQTSGAGTGATLTFNDNFSVAGIRTTALGTDYTTAPAVTTTSGSGLIATAVLSSVSLIGINNSLGGPGDLVIKSRISGIGGGFTKTGTGTLVLAGVNTYTGDTVVDSGRLLINGDNSAATGDVIATGGVLGGSGTFGGDVFVLSGATLAPGSSIESLRINAAANLLDGAAFAVEVDSAADLGVAADLLVATGDFSLLGTVTLTLADIASTPQVFAADTTFSLVNYGGLLTGGFTYGDTLLTEGSQFSAAGTTWRIHYAAATGGSNYTGENLTSGQFINIVAVPEPGTVGLLAAGLTAALLAVGTRDRRDWRTDASADG